jgi:acyl-CoA dehydrogenase
VSSMSGLVDVDARCVEGDVGAMLGDMAYRLFESHCTQADLIAAEHGEWPSALWLPIEETGLTLALVPESLGGSGASLTDTVALLRATGRFAVPVPIAETLLGNWLLARAGLRPSGGAIGLACGIPFVVPLARDHQGLEVNSTAIYATDVVVERVPDWRLSCSMSHVAWGRAMTHVVMLVVLPDGIRAVARVPINAARIDTSTNVAGEPRDTLVFDNVPLDATQLCQLPHTIDYAQLLLHMGAAVRCQQMAGAMEWILERTCLYAAERVQFGRAIGGFQAVQHMIAVMAEQVSAAVVAADGAIATLAEGGVDGLEAVPQAQAMTCGYAKSRVGEAASEVFAIAHQVHAAMGYSHEHPLHWRTRRLLAWREEFGAERFWTTRAGAALTQRGATCFWTDLVAM